MVLPADAVGLMWHCVGSLRAQNVRVLWKAPAQNRTIFWEYTLLRYTDPVWTTLLFEAFRGSTIVSYDLLQWWCRRCHRLDVNPYSDLFSAIKLFSTTINFFVTQIQYWSLSFLKLFEAAPLQATTCYDDDVADAIGLMWHCVGSLRAQNVRVLWQAPAQNRNVCLLSNRVSCLWCRQCSAGE